MDSRKLKLYFKDDLSNAKSLTVDYTRDTYDPAELSAAMDQMIGSSVLVTKDGPIASKTRAEFEIIQKEDLALA